MKRLKLIACAVGVVTGSLVSVAHAGQIQASAPSYAREVIPSDTINITMPVVGYKLFGSVDSRTQTTRFSIEIDLVASGTFPGVYSAIPTPAQVFIADQNLPLNGYYTAKTTSTTNGGKTLVAEFEILQSTGAYFPNPIISANVATGAAAATFTATPPVISGAGAGKLNTLGAFVKLASCETGPKVIQAKVKHKDGAGIEDDSARDGSTNIANILVFPTTHYVQVSANTKAATLSATSANQLFIAGGDGGTMKTGAASTGGALATNLMLLGRFDIMESASPKLAAGAILGIGTDAGPIAPANYSVGDGSVATYSAPVVTGATNAAAPNYEVSQFKVDVTAAQGFATGATVFLASNSACTAVIPSVATTTGNTISLLATAPATIANLDTSALLYPGNATDARMYICQSITGASQVPASGFSAKVSVIKATGALGEQDNVCEGPLASLGGALKIDVRNYIPASVTTATGWSSTLRLINTSDVFNNVKVYAQTIHTDGKIGNSAQIATLKAREAIYMTNAQIETLLAAGQAPNGGAANNGAAVAANGGNNARIRITAEGGDTLRVQNYLYNPATKNFIEASSSQGVDFDGTGNRVSDTADRVNQDAQSGIDLK
jgi:hypothetical protein